MVNGFSQVETSESCVFYDLPQYEEFWAVLEDLGIPFYMHPRNPISAWSQIYDGHPWLLGPTWAFGQETAVHALRLMASGLFDRHPRINIVLGHLGEGLPYSLWRIDNCNAWVDTPKAYPAKRALGDYFRSNFHLTTSGNFHTSTLHCALAEVGADRILFSTDWPLENVDHAATWFDCAAVSDVDRMKIGRNNAIRLFKLPL
jgi:2,3-dihydroxybenzoate decarboxylase